MTLQELLKERAELLGDCDRMLNAAQEQKRQLNTIENVAFENHMAKVKTIDAELESRKAKNPLTATLTGGKGLFALADRTEPKPKKLQRVLSADYQRAFAAYIQSGGKHVDEALTEGRDQFGAEGGLVIPSGLEAASYEGGASSGAPIVPLTVEQNIVALAAPEMSVRKLAMVVPTTMDLKLPRKTAFGTAATKAESGAANNSFGGTDPSLEQFTLSAFMLGHIADASWELLQDVTVFQSFLVEDILTSIAILEDGKFLSGSGTGEPEGLIGNTGAGVTGVAAGTDSYADELLQATFNVMGLLNAVYHPNAAWLMSRATSVVLRKAQSTANLFYQIWNRVGNQDFLHGYPVEYSTNMPSIATTNTPVLFGDFKAGYIIGDRGGSGVNVKILDQPKAVYGLTEFLGYRRTDGRVRRSEAIQAITLA